MTPERWSRVRQIFESVVDEPATDQQAFVQGACQGDSGLQAEVLRLLEAFNASTDFLEAGPGDLHGSLEDAPFDEPALAVGLVLVRRFEIRSFINRGGMGEVYEAWDAQLNQLVALKTILPYISANPAVIDRFKREVRHAREVSHPNICRVHELFCEDTVAHAPIWFLSMELLRGSTLRERLRTKGSLAPTLAMNVANQLLAGLEAAHARGLVHRDFKSSNVMLLDGSDLQLRVVITDFGLAITNVPGGMGASDLISTGTPGYMPPEQKRGEVVGPAADQYAFGVVLWEMMTGLAPPILGAPPVGARSSPYPGVWSRVIQRCTAMEPRARFANMTEVRAALFPTHLRKRIVVGIAAATLPITAIGLLLQRHIPQMGTTCVICNTVQITPDVDRSETPSLSRDGRMVAYSSDRAEPGNLDIFVQSLPAGPVFRVTHDGARDTAPSISPDGTLVAFRSERDGGGIYIASTQQPGKPRLLVHGGRDPRISPDGSSVLYWTGDPDSSAPSGKAFRIALAGGDPQPVAPQFKDARYPVWNSDNKQVLLTGCLTPGLLPDCLDWWIGQTGGSEFTPTHAFPILRAHSFLPGRLSSLEWQDNQVIFSAMNAHSRLNLAALPLPSVNPQEVGEPRWLLATDSGDLDPSLSPGGQIAFTRTTGALHVWKAGGLSQRNRLSFEKVTADPEVDGQPFVAEGGRYLVFTRGRSARRAIVLRDLVSGQERVIEGNGLSMQSPVIDSSGTWLAFQQTEPTGVSAVYAGQVGTAMKRICENCSNPFGWFDHNRMFFYRSGLKTLALADPRTAQQQAVLSDPEATLGDASWSPESSDLVLVASFPTRKRVEIVHLDRRTLRAGAPTFMPQEDGDPIHPRWFQNGSGIVYVSNRDGFMCLYRRHFNGKTRKFGESLSATHIHHQRASIDEVLPRVLNLSADGDTLFVNLGEQSSTIQVGRFVQGRSSTPGRMQ